MNLKEIGIMYLKFSSAVKRSRGFVFHLESQIDQKLASDGKKQDTMSHFVTGRRVFHRTLCLPKAPLTDFGEQCTDDEKCNTATW